MIERPRDDIVTDLVEYLVVVVPGRHAVAAIGPELERLVESSAIRILDLVVVVVDEDGVAEVIEADSIESLADLCVTSPCIGALLSRHDIELVSLALQPQSAAVVVVAEDRWAESLAAATRSAGGEVRAGERIARQRVEAALAHASAAGEEG